MTNTTPAAARKIAALLAHAERIDAPGVEHEAASAAYLAGRKAHEAGLTTECIWQEWGRGKAHAAWCHFVDGWYDASEGK